MSSISPESSASQYSCTDAHLIVQPFDMAAFADVIKAAQSCGDVDVGALADRMVGSYHAYLRRVGVDVPPSSQASQISGVSSGSGSGVSVGSRAASISRYHVLRNKVSWRLGDNSARSDDGYCYLKAVRKGKRELIRRELGAWPSFFSLMGVSRSAFIPERKLQTLRVGGDVVKAHLDEVNGKEDFFSVMVALSAVARPAVTPDSIYYRLRQLTAKSTSFLPTTSLGGKKKADFPLVALVPSKSVICDAEELPGCDMYRLAGRVAVVANTASARARLQDCNWGGFIDEGNVVSHAVELCKLSGIGVLPYASDAVMVDKDADLVSQMCPGVRFVRV